MYRPPMSLHFKFLFMLIQITLSRNLVILCAKWILIYFISNHWIFLSIECCPTHNSQRQYCASDNRCRPQKGQKKKKFSWKPPNGNFKLLPFPSQLKVVMLTPQALCVFLLSGYLQYPNKLWREVLLTYLTATHLHFSYWILLKSP